MSTDVAGPDGSALSEGLCPAAWAVMAFGRVQKLVVRADVADELARKWRETDSGATAVPLYTWAAVEGERELLAGQHDLEAMCEAFHRLIEAHANLRIPFHQPVCADAQVALRILRGIVAELRA